MGGGGGGGKIMRTLQSLMEYQVNLIVTQPVVSFIFGSFSQTEIISHAQYNVISINADIIRFIWRRTFPIFENLLKTLGTTTKVLSCLKIPLTGMRVDRFVSCQNIVPKFQTSVILPTPGLVPKSPWRNSSTDSAEEFYYSFYCSEGLENKPTSTAFRLG